MCKLSLDAAAAMIQGKNFKRANTEVYIFGNFAKLYLHGNNIATYNLKTEEGVYCSCGWNTPTTRSRLNALPGLRVSMAGGSCNALESDGWSLSKNKYFAQYN